MFGIVANVITTKEKMMNRSEQIDKALKDILKDVDCAKRNKQCDIDYFLSSIEKCAKVALALPRRNCDVGTDEEQDRMFRTYCRDNDCNHFCGRCPNRYRPVNCGIFWAQMSCESEAKNGPQE